MRSLIIAENEDLLQVKNKLLAAGDTAQFRVSPMDKPWI